VKRYGFWILALGWLPAGLLLQGVVRFFPGESGAWTPEFVLMAGVMMLQGHHDEAATIIEKAAGVPKEAFLMALATARYPLDVVPAAEIEGNIKALFQAGIESGYMKQMPDDGIIYRGKVR